MGRLGVLRISSTILGMMRARAFLFEMAVWAGRREEQVQ